MTAQQISHTRTIRLTEFSIMGIIFVVLFGMPVLFTRIDGNISWLHVLKIWKDQFLLIPIYLLHHTLLAPKLLLRRKYFLYGFLTLLLIGACSFSYYYVDMVMKVKQSIIVEVAKDRPAPIPPFAHLLMYSLLIVGVDAGLLFSKKWHADEEQRYILEKQNAEMQLEILRNQVNPHFFMNTLNNIYALIDLDGKKAKDSVMKLSKMMRYLLYETSSGSVPLNKELEFIESYIDLMKIRFSNEVTIDFQINNRKREVAIPALLFVSYIENAFKYGTSYEQNSTITIRFDVDDEYLLFSTKNVIYSKPSSDTASGIGINNNQHRLDLLYGNRYSLTIDRLNNQFEVTLKIPLS